MMDRLKDKVAIVTGAGGNVGGITAALFAQEGATVICTDLVDMAPIEEVQRGGGLFLTQDVSDEGQWQALAARVQSEYGRLDIVVNNAAMCVANPITEETLENWSRSFTVNAQSVFLSIKHLLPIMAEEGGGSIVNVSSLAALSGSPLTPVYAASKAAVASLTQSVAAHCVTERNNVRCNSVHPGAIDPPMFPAELQGEARAQILTATRAAIGHYMCQPEDIARAILFLGSDEARHINGVAVPIDNSASVTLPY